VLRKGEFDMRTHDDGGGCDIRIIANDLLDEIQAERNHGDESEYDNAQADALALFGAGHDPKVVARALWVAIADRLSAPAN
jgi:hypothetical protein